MKFAKKPPSTEIPTASTADIAFLLIVYFMLTSVFSAVRGLDFTLPKEDVPEQKIQEESVEIKIFPDGNLLVDQKPMQLGQVLDYLKPKLLRNPEKPVILIPFPETHYRYMVDVFDELRQGEEKIGIEVKNISIPTRRDLEMISTEFGIDFFGG